MPMGQYFNFFNQKKFFRPIWGIIFYKMFLYFDILTWSWTLNLGFSLSFYLLKLIYVLEFTSACFILTILWYVLLYLFSILSNLSIYTFFEIEVKDSDKSFSNNRITFIMCSIHSFITILQPWFHWSIVEFAAFIYPYFAWSTIRLT